jgi:hypothetical protein
VILDCGILDPLWFGEDTRQLDDETILEVLEEDKISLLADAVVRIRRVYLTDPGGQK